MKKLRKSCKDVLGGSDPGRWSNECKVLRQGHGGWVFFSWIFLKNTESNSWGLISDIFSPARLKFKAVSTCLKQEQILKMYFWKEDSTVSFMRAGAALSLPNVPSSFLGGMNKCSWDFYKRENFRFSSFERKSMFLLTTAEIQSAQISL